MLGFYRKLLSYFLAPILLARFTTWIVYVTEFGPHGMRLPQNTRRYAYWFCSWNRRHRLSHCHFRDDSILMFMQHMCFFMCRLFCRYHDYTRLMHAHMRGTMLRHAQC